MLHIIIADYTTFIAYHLTNTCSLIFKFINLFIKILDFLIDLTV